MIIEPKVKGFICITAHPAGCEKNVLNQINYVKEKGLLKGRKKVLVIGASTGYGLASRIVSAFGCGADTLGVFFERPGNEKKPASAGYYNSLAFEKYAKESDLYCKSINGDAFSHEIKQKTVNLIKKDLGQVDLVIYSLASPKRTHPETGKTYTSVLKPIGESFFSKTIDTKNGIIKEISIDAATSEDIEATKMVMGGEDWSMWMTILKENGVLAEGVKTLAYSYIGPKVTRPVYRKGTIGRAKEDLENSCKSIENLLSPLNGSAFVSVNKALVTQSSSAIPVVPLYIAVLYKVMKKKGTHEGCIGQIDRLYRNFLFSDEKMKVDENGLIRLDDWEMDSEVQAEVEKKWPTVTTENVFETTDLKAYQKEFLQLFGFEMDGVDYSAEQDPNKQMTELVE